MLKRTLLSTTLLATLLACTANADEAGIKKTLLEKFPGADITSITKTPYSGLYEVLIDGQVVYADENANYLFVGSVVDVKTRQNLTNERLEKLNAIRFDSLPFADAIKTVKGNGKRQLAIFSDPDCPFCKRLEQELTKVSNVTIYTFLYPIVSLHPDSAANAKAIWCAPDRNQAWDDAMLRGVMPKNNGTCKNPVESNIALGNKYRVTGTPTLIFANGQRVPGMVPADKVNELLDAAGKGK
ncbi:thiol:disulfide interchange protein DsbC [Sulfuriferula plumbiphila]|uniref:Thiol:disulfide interchange protein n=1 Tax=Sulfuriferula plumbiphila TaxID=171865 RepID=A0A512L6W9_9PROT|nr:DsbC family protein [Sulfuriferula plumbiphila]BBP02904.1 thiol:disulfide interchange protein DsbC [Sulfuriferula plumbiphila]GEP30229.1 thiol:disulfide interchange protein DsbC [Sulfuriferula plumbiphila]